LLDDIRFVNQANKDEIEQLRAHIGQRIKDANLTENEADVVAREVSNLLGKLSAKVKLTEKAIHSLSQASSSQPGEASGGVSSEDDEPVLQFGIDEFYDNENLLPMQTSENGINYAWSSIEPEIYFTFPLDRSKPLGMAVRLFSVIKPAYVKQLKIMVDGRRVKHRALLDNGFIALSCNLPASEKANQTEIQIILPATHSPASLGVSKDSRKLGIAITDFRFGKTESDLEHLLRRIKSRL
jgi:hypothetical protein